MNQMWSPPGLNVESYVEPLRSPRSGVVAHRPPRSLGQLDGKLLLLGGFRCFGRFGGCPRPLWGCVDVSRGLVVVLGVSGLVIRAR